MKLPTRTALFVLYALAAQCVLAQKTFEAFSGAFGPSTPVRYAKPTLLWEVWSPGAHVTSAKIKIDGKSVDATYDDKRRAMFYTPGSPLETGRHHIDCRVTFNGKQTFTKSWDMEVVADALRNLPAANEAQKEILKIANAYRRAQGLPEFLLDERLNAAATAHIEYLVKHQTMGHEEFAQDADYIGKTGSDRCAVFGWCGGSWEDVSFGDTTAEFGVRNLFDAPYHRIPFMQPGNIGIGGDYDHTRITVEFGRSPASGTVVSPADGEYDIPTTWWCHERPNPLRMHTQVDHCGYPIVLAYFGPDVDVLDVAYEGLTDPEGTPVACWLNTPATDKELNKASILIPEAPLKPLTKYTVTATYRTGGDLITKTWKFTTAAR